MNVVEVYADIWCPFTHIGLRRLADRAAASATALEVRAHPWPLELVNGAPLEASFVAEEVGELRSGVAPDLFAGFDESRFPTTTLPALALVESAYAIGPARGYALTLAVRSALFEQGRDISDPGVLNELATELSIPPVGPEHHVAVRAGRDAGRARGVLGSPHFFTSAGGFFCPALDIERVDGTLQITADPAAFEEFVASCFETRRPL